MDFVDREAELEQFRLDPTCVVLLVSMRSGGGAAGLTLTMAECGFILEPSVNVCEHSHARAWLVMLELALAFV